MKLSPSEERVFNITLGLSVVAWAFIGVWRDIHAGTGWTLVRSSLSFLQLHVGILFCVRSPLILDAPWSYHLRCLPSLLLSGVSFRLAPAANEWPPHATSLFALGTVIAAISLVCLGRSFSIMPAMRKIISKGPYRWVRHPIYSGELLMITACFLAGINWLTAIPLGLILPLVALRIQTEEALLTKDPQYRAYQSKVQYRIIPGIW